MLGLFPGGGVPGAAFPFAPVEPDGSVFEAKAFSAAWACWSACCQSPRLFDPVPFVVPPRPFPVVAGPVAPFAVEVVVVVVLALRTPLASTVAIQLRSAVTPHSVRVLLRSRARFSAWS